jgi:hypothetical protein
MRGGTVLALGLLFSVGFGPAAAQDGTGVADVFLKQRGDSSYAGEDLLSIDGAGQSRSLIVHDRLVVIVKVQNDGDSTQTFSVEALPPTPDSGFALRFLRAGADVTEDILAGDLSLDVPAGRTQTIRVEVDARDAEFAAVQRVLVTAGADGDSHDAAYAEITKVS